MHLLLEIHEAEYVFVGDMYQWNVGHGFNVLQWKSRDGSFQYGVSFAHGKYEPLFTVKSDVITSTDIDALNRVLVKLMYKNLFEVDQRTTDTLNAFSKMVSAKFTNL